MAPAVAVRAAPTVRRTPGIPPTGTQGGAGADAVATFEQKAKDLLAQADAYRELSSNLAHEDA
jgi:hypothetical protein